MSNRPSLRAVAPPCLVAASDQRCLISALPSWSGQFDNLTSSYFSPIPALRVEKADLTLLGLTSMAVSVNPVDDPWFRSTTHVHQSGSKLGYTNTTMQLWYADNALSVLGCLEQYQLCNMTGCSPLDGRLQLANLSFSNREQQATHRLLISMLGVLYLQQAFDMFGASLLLAQDSFLSSGLASAGLPADQWRAEVANMGAITLAALQRRIVDFAVPPNTPIRTTLNGTVGARAFLRPTPDSEGGLLCGSIRVRDARYRNFSVAGVAVILSLGATITLINALCIPGAVFRVRRRFGWGGSFAEREWREGGLLRLQRTAFEAHGVRPWEAGEDGVGEVPVTMDERLAFSAESMWNDGGKRCGPSYGFLAGHQDPGRADGDEDGEGDEIITDPQGNICHISSQKA